MLGCSIEGEWAAGGNAVAIELLAAGVDGIGEGFGCWAAVGAVDLDAKVALGPAGVVAGRKDDAANGLALADQVGGRRGGEDAASGQHNPAQAMGCCHPGDDINRAAVAVAAITAHHQGAALHPRKGAEDRLDETFEVVRLLELLTALAQS